MTTFPRLLDRALHRDQPDPLESRLTARPRPDLPRLRAFAAAVNAYLVRPDPDVAALEALLDRWAADPAPENDPHIALPLAAVLAYTEAAVSRPEWRDDEIAKLRRLAADPRRPVREAANAALDRLGTGE